MGETMTSPRITFTYSTTGGGATDPWWVRLEQEDLPDDTATLDDAANLLDTLYNLDACAEEEEPTETVTDPSADDVDETVEITVDRMACKFDADGNVDVTLRVIRSRQDAPYKLVLSGGTLLTTETITEPYSQTILVENASSITLDYPVIGDFQAAWTGAVYSTQGVSGLQRTGNTIDFGGDVSSGSIIVSYLTTYDRCTVTINGVNGEAGACTARVFFHGLVDELELEIPEASEPLASCTSRWTVAPIDYDIECVRIVTVSTRCQCTDKEAASRTYEEIVDCPESIVRCQGTATECRIVVGSITITEYVECTDDNKVTGRPGMIYSLSTPEYYEDHCCSPPTFSLPDCPEKKISHKGGLPLSGGAASYYNIYGPKLRITPVSPAGGICGNWFIKQKVVYSNCCDGVEPLAWDTSVSPGVMSPNSSATIGVTGGGRYPYEWTLTGRGVQFANGSTRIITDGQRVYMAALPLACGWVEVRVSDGCTEVVAGIRITSGAWVFVGDYFSDNLGTAHNVDAMLIGYCGQLLHSDVYLGFSEDGDSSRFSSDGRYWMGGGTALIPAVPGTVGVKFYYGGSYNTRGVPEGEGCLNGYAPMDPIVGKFNPVLAKSCVSYKGGVYSRVPTSAITIYEWSC